MAPDAVFPQSLCEALLALAFIREHAEGIWDRSGQYSHLRFFGRGPSGGQHRVFLEPPIVREASVTGPKTAGRIK